MRIWTYLRPFKFEDQDFIVEITLGFTKCASRLFLNNELLSEDSYSYVDGLKTITHEIPRGVNLPAAIVEVGYFNWWNIGIQVKADSQICHQSHPGRDVRFGEGLLKNESNKVQDSIMNRDHNNWQRNKYSVYADLVLGGIFFIVGKLTEDLTLAAFIGAAAGLALVVIQRFVRVDLLGGFAVFGTVMLLISAAFSLVFQDDYWVQMKGSVLGLLTASLFMADGLFRRGAYFGARIERYMPLPLHHGRIAIGMSLTGVCMAGLNYLVANHFSEDFWLTYTTFLDLPVAMVCFYIAMYWARKEPNNSE